MTKSVMVRQPGGGLSDHLVCVRYSVKERLVEAQKPANHLLALPASLLQLLIPADMRMQVHLYVAPVLMCQPLANRLQLY